MRQSSHALSSCSQGGRDPFTDNVREVCRRFVASSYVFAERGAALITARSLTKVRDMTKDTIRQVRRLSTASWSSGSALSTITSLAVTGRSENPASSGRSEPKVPRCGRPAAARAGFRVRRPRPADSLEAEGLVAVRKNPEDPRVRRANLTKAGRAEHAQNWIGDRPPWLGTSSKHCLSSSATDSRRQWQRLSGCCSRRW